MTLAALIRKSEVVRFATATPATVATQAVEKGRTVASVATVSVATHTEAKAASASRWWLIHYPDREPEEVWMSPPATHAEVLADRPEAIAAEPIHEPQGIESKAIPKPEAQPRPRPAPACRTCAHVTGRGGCGEPVAAGLSNLEGVIRYHPQGGKGCPAFRPEGTP